MPYPYLRSFTPSSMPIIIIVIMMHLVSPSLIEERHLISQPWRRPYHRLLLHLHRAHQPSFEASHQINKLEYTFIIIIDIDRNL